MKLQHGPTRPQPQPQPQPHPPTGPGPAPSPIPGPGPRRRGRRLLEGLLAATVVVLGLVFLRTLSPDAASWSLEFFSRRFTYAYVFVATALVFTGLGYVLGRRIDRLKQLSATDPLTGLANRRACEARLRDECARARRYRLPLALLLIDVDGLKGINDRGGHAAGDRVLKATGRAIGATMRATDFGCRWGGDEFAIIASNTDGRAAERLAQRLLRQVVNEKDGGDAAVTISVGVATNESGQQDGVSAEDLWKAADAALYAAKDEGRNRVKVA